MTDKFAAPADVAAPPPSATRTASGMHWTVLKPGSGACPSAGSTVTVHYSGWTSVGTLFDSSRKRGAPASFRLDRVIKGWTEGLQLMAVGSSARFWIPAALAYGENPGGGRPGGMLVFDIELISVREPPVPPVTPEDVAAPPPSAERTATGLASRVLRAGTGTRRPTSRHTVAVHYSGWTKDGRLFDSSVARGEPTSFPLDRVIKGWTEGVQLMVEGERRRFWIPANLAYGDNPGGGRPGGTLVFDIELIKIG